MAHSLFSEVERDMKEQGWNVEGPFISVYVGDGHFVIQMRPAGEPMNEMYSTIVETFSEVQMIGRA